MAGFQILDRSWHQGADAIPANGEFSLPRPDEMHGVQVRARLRVRVQEAHQVQETHERL